MTYLEETYFQRSSSNQDFALHRVFADDGSLDKSLDASSGDVVLVPKAHTRLACVKVTKAIVLTSWRGHVGNGGLEIIQITHGLQSEMPKNL